VTINHPIRLFQAKMHRPPKWSALFVLHDLA